MRGGALLALAATGGRRAQTAMGTQWPRIDSHLHVWSEGADWADGASPPDALRAAATIDSFVHAARASGVDGAVIVHHNFAWTRDDPDVGIDHSYVQSALERHPAFFRALAIADPRLGSERAVRALETLNARGFTGVRFNPAMFAELEGGLSGPVGRALYARAGELGMPVGVMAFGGLHSCMAHIEALLAHSPSTRLIIDHLGFFRQKGADDSASLQDLLALARAPQVYVKASAFMRLVDEPYPAASLAPTLTKVVKAFGASRVMWGSDFPYALLGRPMPPGASAAPDGKDGLVEYADVAGAIERWPESVAGLTREEVALVLGGTASELFWSDQAAVRGGDAGAVKTTAGGKDTC